MIYGIATFDPENMSMSSLKPGRESKLARMWRKVIDSCYADKCGGAQEVCEQWLVFSEFCNWANDNWFDGAVLSTKIIADGNPIGPENTMLITKKLSGFLNPGRKKSCLPDGVSFEKDRSKYLASCSNPNTGKIDKIGRYESPSRAHHEWKKRKLIYAAQILAEEPDQRARKAVLSMYL